MVVTDDEATNTVLQVYNYVKPAKKLRTWNDYREALYEGLVSSLISQRLSRTDTKRKSSICICEYRLSTQFIRGYNTFTSFAMVGQGTVQDAIDALIAETNRARQFGFLQTELDRVKASLLNEAEKAFNEKDKSESGHIVRQYVN